MKQLDLIRNLGIVVFLATVIACGGSGVSADTTTSTTNTTSTVTTSTATTSTATTSTATTSTATTSTATTSTATTSTGTTSTATTSTANPFTGTYTGSAYKVAHLTGSNIGYHSDAFGSVDANGNCLFVATGITNGHNETLTGTLNNSGNFSGTATFWGNKGGLPQYLTRPIYKSSYKSPNNFSASFYLNPGGGDSHDLTFTMTKSP